MRISCLAATFVMAVLALPACGGSGGNGSGGAGSSGAGSGGAGSSGAGSSGAGSSGAGGSAAGSGGSGGTTAKPPFEIDGSWIYLGPSDQPHILKVDDSSMVYTAVAGDWSSNWTITSYDNALHHFQVAFGSGSGTYVPMGASMSGTYDLNGTVLTVQVAQGLASYPQVQDAGTCTSAADGTPVPDCRLYIKQN